MTVPAIDYHERTKHSPASIREMGFSLDFDNKPIPFKRYENLPTQSLARTIQSPQQPALAAITETDSDPLSETEQPSPKITLDVISQLCYFSTGVTKERDASFDRSALDRLFLAASCTGKLYHIDLYLVCGEHPLPTGVYHSTR